MQLPPNRDKYVLMFEPYFSDYEDCRYFPITVATKFDYHSTFFIAPKDLADAYIATLDMLDKLQSALDVHFMRTRHHIYPANLTDTR